MSKIYAGLSAFFANRPGNHNWLDNFARPFLSLIRTKPSGKKRYDDLFLNKNAFALVDVTGQRAKKVEVPANHVVLVFAVDVNKPLFNIIEK